MIPERRVWVIAGPTASGKSGLALALAERLNGVVINADALQVYEDLRILTARPSPLDERRVLHRLYGALPGTEPCSAGAWLRRAETEIASALDNRMAPIVVGGTGLYLDALINGLAPIPNIDPAVREAGVALYDEIGGARFHQMLATRDPVTAARLPPQDRQRLSRAWEVLEATGQPLADWQKIVRPRKQDFHFVSLLLYTERAKLYENCDRRLAAMLSAGAIDEVAALQERGLDSDTPVSKAVGVREFGAYLAGTSSLQAATALAQTNTRHLAKRQTTWFRHRFSPDHVLREKLNFNRIREFLSEIT